MDPAWAPFYAAIEIADKSAGPAAVYPLTWIFWILLTRDLRDFSKGLANKVAVLPLVVSQIS